MFSLLSTRFSAIFRPIVPIPFTNLVARMSGQYGYSADYVTNKLKESLKTTHLDVVDVSDGCGAKFDCIIVSPSFEGKTPLERHRMVNAVLEEEMKTIHAFTMRTLTPVQWEKQQQKQ